MITSMQQARNKLLTLVEILKASSLLLEVEDGSYREAPSLVFVEEGNGFVRMHDVVRDVTKAIASKDPHHQFVVKEDVRLQEWEKRDGELRNCTGISLKCTHVHELPEGLIVDIWHKNRAEIYDSKEKQIFFSKEKLGIWKYIFIHCIALYIELKHNRKSREFANF